MSSERSSRLRRGARWISADRRPLLLGSPSRRASRWSAPSCRREAERVAAASSFLALVGESLERATTVEGRARRLVDEMLTDDRATFVAVHLSTRTASSRRSRAAARGRPSSRTTSAGPSGSQRAISTGNRDARTGRPAGGRQPAPSLLVLPLRARGHSLGALTLRIAPGADWRPVMIARASPVRSRAARRSHSTTRFCTSESATCRTPCSWVCSAARFPTFERVVVTPRLQGRDGRSRGRRRLVRRLPSAVRVGRAGRRRRRRARARGGRRDGAAARAP